MNKKTIVIVSLTLVLALLAVAVIATFPTYLFEDTVPSDTSSSIQSGVITESESTVGDDVGNLADDKDDENGAEGVLPMPDDTTEEDSSPESEEPSSPETEKPEISDIKVDKLEMLAKAKNMKVYAQYGAYPDGTKVKINKLGAFDKAFYRARHYLKGISKEFTAYNFSAMKDKQAAYPIADVKLAFEIPKGYNSENIAVYFLTSKNLLELEFKISTDGKTIIVDATQNGVYVFAEKTVDTDSSTESDNSSSQASTPSADNSQTSSTESTSSTTSDKNNTSSEADSNDQTSSNTSSEATSSDSSSNEDTSSEPTSSNTSSEEDTSSEATSSNASSEDTSSETGSNESTSSDATSSDTSSEEDTSSDSTSSVDPNKETMDGWTPWH